MFVLQEDLQELIREDDLIQIADPAQVISRILKAEQEVKSYLRRIYDVDRVFRPIRTFELGETYQLYDRVQWLPQLFDPSQTYNTGDYVNYNGYIYKATADGITGDWDSTNWAFVIKYGALYVCQQESTGNYPDNSDYFTQEDDRDELVKTFVMDIAIYDLHARVNPAQIPQHRIDRRDDAINWLEKAAGGETVMLDLPIAKDDEGDNRTYIQYGSKLKKNWEI